MLPAIRILCQVEWNVINTHNTGIHRWFKQRGGIHSKVS